VQRLAALGTPELADEDRAYLRRELHHLGVTVPAIRTAIGWVLRDTGRRDLTRRRPDACVTAGQEVVAGRGRRQRRESGPPCRAGPPTDQVRGIGSPVALRARRSARRAWMVKASGDIDAMSAEPFMSASCRQ
jgi:hypothetical protein